MLWSTDLLVCNMNNLERKWEVILQIFEARSWSCITDKFCLCWEWGEGDGAKGAALHQPGLWNHK